MKIYDAITNISDDLIDEAVPPLELSQKSYWKQVTGLVASVTLVLGVLYYQPNVLNQGSDNTIPETSGSDSVGTAEENQLDFNEIGGRVSMDMAFPEGYFQIELTDSDVLQAFPKLQTKTPITSIRGVIDYSSQNDVAKFWRGLISIELVDGSNATIQFAEESVPKCVILESNHPIISQIEGVSVTAGISNTFYFADFMLDNIAYNVEMTSPEKAEDLFTDLVLEIISSGSTNLELFANPKIPTELGE